jgi:hypothetical protein
MSDYILVIVVTLAFLIVPLLCFVYLRQRGQKQWAFYTLATALVGLGWLIGLVGVIVASINPIPDTLNCPRCEEQKVSMHETILEQGTGRVLKRPAGYGALAGVFLIFSALMIASSTNMLEFAYISPWVGFMLGFILGPILIVQAAWSEYNYRRTYKVHVFVYECSACHHQWEEHIFVRPHRPIPHG